MSDKENVASTCASSNIAKQMGSLSREELIKQLEMMRALLVEKTIVESQAESTGAPDLSGSRREAQLTLHGTILSPEEEKAAAEALLQPVDVVQAAPDGRKRKHISGAAGTANVDSTPRAKKRPSDDRDDRSVKQVIHVGSVCTSAEKYNDKSVGMGKKEIGNLLNKALNVCVSGFFKYAKKTGAWGSALVEALDDLHLTTEQEEQLRLLGAENKANPLNYTVPYLPFTDFGEGSDLITTVVVPSLMRNFLLACQNDGLKIKKTIKDKASSEKQQYSQITVISRNGAVEFCLDTNAAAGLTRYWQRRAKNNITAVSKDAFTIMYSALKNKFNYNTYSSYVAAKATSGDQEKRTEKITKGRKRRSKKAHTSVQSNTAKKDKENSDNVDESEEESAKEDDGEDVDRNHPSESVEESDSEEDNPAEEVDEVELDESVDEDDDICGLISENEAEKDKEPSNRGRPRRRRTNFDYAGMDE